MFRLQEATIGSAKSPCHALIVSGNGSARKSAAELEAIDDELYASGTAWGRDAHAVVIIANRSMPAWTTAMAASAVTHYDEGPCSALYIAEPEGKTATCISSGNTRTDVGATMAFETQAPEPGGLTDNKR